MVFFDPPCISIKALVITQWGLSNERNNTVGGPGWLACFSYLQHPICYAVVFQSRCSLTRQVKELATHWTRHLSICTAFNVGLDACETKRVLAAWKQLWLRQSIPADWALQLLVYLCHHSWSFSLAPRKHKIPKCLWTKTNRHRVEKRTDSHKMVIN